MKQKKRTTKTKTTTNFIYTNFKQSLKDLKLLKNYLIFITLLFTITTLIGAIFPTLFQEQILKLIAQLIEQTNDLDALELTRFIMVNNIKSSLIALVFGIFLGIVPLMVTVVNAYVLGFVINKSIALEGPLIIWRLFPHGIFEIPAVLISISLGLRLGVLFLSFIIDFIKFYWKKNKLIILSLILFLIPTLIIAIILDKELRKNKGIISFLKVLKSSIIIFLLIVIPLLVIAGIIEGTLIAFLK